MSIYPTSHVLNLVACIIRIYGYRAAIASDFAPPTIDRLYSLLGAKNPPVCDDDRYLAWNARLWAQKALTPRCHAVAQGVFIPVTHLRDAIDIVVCYQDMLKQYAPNSIHLGVKKQPLALIATCYTSKEIPTRNGVIMEYVFKDKDNNLLSFKTKASLNKLECRVGLVYHLAGAVKAHSLLHKQAVTVLERVKVSVPSVTTLAKLRAYHESI